MMYTLCPDPETILAVRDLEVRFLARDGSPVSAVAGADIDLRRGRATALVGESGSGKSQLLHAVLGLTRGRPGVCRGEAVLQPVPGQLLPLLVPQPNRPEPRFAGSYGILRGQLSVIFQGVDSHLHPFHPIRKQLLRKARLLPGDLIRAAGGETEYVRSRLAPLFSGTVEQDRIASRFPAELSGGQRARVGLCLALAASAPFIVADEPTTGLDPGIRLDIYRILRREVEQSERTLFLISHDVDLVARIAEDVFVMRDGRIVERSFDGGAPSLREGYSRMLFSTLPEIVATLSPPAPGPGPDAVRVTASPTTEPAVETAAGGTNPLLLRASGISKSFAGRGAANGAGGTVAVEDVSIEIHRGEAVGLVGESGSGKSTLARILTGLLPADAGEVVFYPGCGNENLVPTDPRYRQHVQLLHQNPDTLLHPRVTVGELCRDSIGLWQERCRFPEVRGFLGFAELASSRAGQICSSLSGGERRRIGLARVLSGRPELVLADEIVSGLDRVLQARIFRNLNALRAEGLSLLVISHDIDLVRHLCSRVLIMKGGRIVDECATGDLQIACRNHHPYTRFLLRAETLELDLSADGESMVSFEGEADRPAPPAAAIVSPAIEGSMEGDRT